MTNERVDDYGGTSDKDWASHIVVKVVDVILRHRFSPEVCQVLSFSFLPQAHDAHTPDYYRII